MVVANSIIDAVAYSRVALSATGQAATTNPNAADKSCRKLLWYAYQIQLLVQYYRTVVCGHSLFYVHVAIM